MFQFEFSFVLAINLFRTVVFQYKSEVRIKIRAILVGIIDFKTPKFASFALRALRKNGYAP